MSNPYQSPQFAEPVLPQVEPIEREKMRRVAKYQQWVLYAVLANIVSYGLMLILSAMGFEGMAALFFWSSTLIVGIFSMIAVFMLTSELLNAGLGVLCAILMIVPCVSLLTLLLVNGRATRFLQQRGVKVGLMGANPDLI